MRQCSAGKEREVSGIVKYVIKWKIYIGCVWNCDMWDVLRVCDEVHVRGRVTFVATCV